ncbi:MAG: PadR family transcriptional regulator, partial [Flavobacteriaceae bacterium]
MNTENTKAQMRKGVLEYCILAVLAKERKYATEILNHLKEAKMIVVEGTLYPLLARLRTSRRQRARYSLMRLSYLGPMHAL